MYSFYLPIRQVNGKVQRIHRRVRWHQSSSKSKLKRVQTTENEFENHENLKMIKIYPDCLTFTNRRRCFHFSLAHWSI